MAKIPEHTDNALSGHHPNDLIIIYSKYEDLLEHDQEQNANMKGGYVPQWFMIDCVDDTRGFSTSPTKALVCQSYEQMDRFGREAILNARTSKKNIRKVVFYYVTSVTSVSGIQPFTNHDVYTGLASF